jgi:hypothetical protein
VGGARLPALDGFVDTRCVVENGWPWGKANWDGQVHVTTFKWAWASFVAAIG